ncbi:Uncharacterised protein [uncultured archaeon]|nr:Uncharacterised protein [uncultured archaeon]
MAVLIKYPKLLLLLLTFSLSYLLFSGSVFAPFRAYVLSSGYAGTFIAGAFFAYGFTAGPATAALLMLAKGQNIFLAGFLGGFGALVSDYLIFRFIRYSFADEIEEFSRERIMSGINRCTPGLLKKYLVPVFAGIIIASPLPDEIGVSLLAASRNISIGRFAMISYVLNTAGIFIILLIGGML